MLWVRRFFRAFSTVACTLAACPTEGALPTAASPRDPEPARWGRWSPKQDRGDPRLVPPDVSGATAVDFSVVFSDYSASKS